MDVRELQDICTLVDPSKRVLCDPCCRTVSAPSAFRRQVLRAVYGLSMALCVNDFWYQVYGMPHMDVVSQLSLKPSLEKVLGFEVVVDDVHMVKEFGRQENFGCVGLATVLAETTRDVQLARSLERIMYLHDERVPDSLWHVPLGFAMRSTWLRLITFSFLCTFMANTSLSLSSNKLEVGGCHRNPSGSK